MSYDIQIKVDPGNSAQAVKTVTDGLTQAEQRGKAAGESMLGLSGAFKSLAAAMQQEQAALARLNTQHEQLAVKNSGLVGSFNGLAQAIGREQAMLEQINGPMLRYEKDLQTLDGLMAKGVITTKQYADQVSALNARVGERPEQMGEMYGPVQQAPSTGGGMLAGAIAGASIIGGVAIFQQLAGAVEGASRAFQDAEDHLTEVRNHALKFVDSGNDVNKVMADQQQLAHDLRAPLKETMDLYDAIGDATSELNLSQRQLIEITKNVGEATTIANKPLSSAGDIISRLAVGFESGGDASRSVRKLIADYKDLADIWTDVFHTSKAGLLEMVKDHKVGFEQMTLALTTHGHASEALFAQMHRSNLSYRQEISGLAEMFEAQGENQYDAIQDAIKKYRELDATLKPLTERFALLADNSKSAARSIVESSTMLQTWTAIAASIGVANQADLKVGGEYISAREHAMKELAGLQQAESEGLIKGAGATEFYRKTWEQLTTTIQGRLPAAYVIQMQLSDATNDYHRNLAALDSLFASHTIRLDQYTAKLHQLSDAYNGPEVRKVFEQLNTSPSSADLQVHQQALIAQDHGDRDYAAESVAPMTATAAAAERYRLELAQLNDMIERGVVDQDQANARLAQYHEELNKGVGAVDATTQHQKELQAALDAIKKPQFDYQNGTSILNELLADGAINATEYADAIKKVKDSYDATQKHSQGFTAGLERGWHDITKSSLDTATEIESAMKSAFDSANQSLLQFVTTGQTSLSSLASTLEQLLMKLALQGVEGGIASLFSPGAAAGPAGGAAALLAGGGDASSGLAGLANIINGSGMPHFANGGAGYIGGSGGTDSQLFMARVTPGEHFQFTPPNQMADARKGGQSSSGGHTVVNLNYDPKAIRSGKDIEDGVLNVIRKNPSAVRALLGR